jgi:phosphotransferase system enzyme I (PtsI)
METLHGIAASRGIAIGTAFHFKQAEIHIERRTIKDTAAEWARFQEALGTARQQLEQVYERAKAESGAKQADIFKAHMLMLEDPELLDIVKAAVEQEGINAEAALHDATEAFAREIEALDDEYQSARALDIRDVSSRVLRILLGIAESPTEGLTRPSIILARDLTPSDTVLLDKSLVLGFCTAMGGATSHTAILARSLGIPAVVGAGLELMDIPANTYLVLDGNQGTVVIRPDGQTLEMYQKRQTAFAAVLAEARQSAHQPAVTADGYQVEVVANIGNVEGAQTALDDGAEGVGLLRSEFLYLERSNLPTEEEQYQAYKTIADTFGELPVILRSLDIGGDKELPYLEMSPEDNPFLGVRAIRLCFAQPDLFKPQLRAALRAGVGNNLKLMFPMVATVGEVRQARAMLDQCREELRAEGHPVAGNMEIGIMVEIPSAALIADQLAEEVDFFSIGTNDLSQYTMAADRTNAQVAPLASGFQPAVLRLIRHVIDAAHARGKWVGLCGELAGEPVAIPILLGLGLDEFSMNSPAIPVAKQIIRAVSLQEAQQLASEALNLNSVEAIQNLVKNRIAAVNAV